MRLTIGGWLQIIKFKAFKPNYCILGVLLTALVVLTLLGAIK